MTRTIALPLGLLALASLSNSCFAADRILFDRLGPREATLFVSNADGSAERPLTQPGSLDYNPSWSPKGDWIVFTSERAGSADLFRIHPDGTGDRTPHRRPGLRRPGCASRRMGSKIVFVSTRGADWRTSGFSTPTRKRPRALTSGKGGDFRPSWSPDGHGSPSLRIATATFPPPKADGSGCIWSTFI